MNTLIRLHNSGDYTLIRTYDRKHGRSRYFYLSNDEICKWLNNGGGYFHDRDCHDYLSIMPADSEDFSLRISWLSESYGELSGYIQNLTIPQSLMISVVRGDTVDASYMHQERSRSKSSVILSERAHRNVAEMPPHIRRAFSKFMRDHFNYAQPSTINIYADGNAVFYFEDDCKKFSMNGGIVLSTVSRRHRNGTSFCHRYSMHT